MDKEKECAVKFEVEATAGKKRIRVKISYYHKATKAEIDAWRGTGLEWRDDDGKKLVAGEFTGAKAVFVVRSTANVFPPLQALFYSNPQIFPALLAEMEKFRDSCVDEDVKKLAEYACGKIKEIAKI